MKFEYEIPKDSMDKLHKLFDHSFEKMKEAKIRFEKGVETEEDLLKYYPNFRLKYEDKNKVKELDVVELRYYEKLVEITNRKNELIKEISKYLVSIRDCPAEDFGVDLDCENNCSIEDELIIKCWIKYFESKLKND